MRNMSSSSIITAAEDSTAELSSFGSMAQNQFEQNDVMQNWLNFGGEDQCSSRPLLPSLIASSRSASISSSSTDAFKFEIELHRLYRDGWLSRNWHISLYVSAAYLATIFAARHLMRGRAPFDLRPLLAAWSAALALFSLAGTLRTGPEIVGILARRGFAESYCTNEFVREPTLAAWYYMFVWSKVIELGDTAFVVLRKRPLIPLHWIHHTTTLCYAFFVIADEPGTARWMVSMNFAIHTVMYGYYAVRAFGGVRVPRVVSISITAAQIAQMVVGVVVNYRSLRITEKRCATSVAGASLGLCIYALFFALFVKFFITTYCGLGSSASGKRKMDQKIE